MAIHSNIGRAVLLAAAFLLGGDPAAARAEAEALTLGQAVARAVAGNPALRGSEHLVRAAEAREERAAQAPPHTVGLDLEDFAGSGDLSGADALQTTLRLSGVLELGGKRQARIGFAAEETGLTRLAQETARLDLLAEVAARFATVAAREEELEVLRESTRLAEETLARVAERLKIGAAPRYELQRAEIRLARARIDLEHGEHELASARVRLAATWGSTTPDFENVAAELFRFPDVRPVEELMAEIDASPAVRQLLSRERLAAAQARLAESATRMDVSWTAGVRHIESLGESALVASVTLPVGARRRAAPALREAEAALARAPLDTEAARVATNALLFELWQDLAHARLEATTLHGQVRPLAESVLEATGQAFRQGRSSFLEYAAAQEQLLDVRRDAVAAAVEYHALLVEIERLTGTAVGADSTNAGEMP